MRTAALKALYALSEERMRIRDLAKAIGLSYREAAEIVKDLLQKGYLVKSGGRIELASMLFHPLEWGSRRGYWKPAR